MAPKRISVTEYVHMLLDVNRDIKKNTSFEKKPRFPYGNTGLKAT